MNRTRQTQAASPIPLPGHRCPACGMPSPALLALIQGRRALIEACPICGRKQATAVTPEQACRLMQGDSDPCPAPAVCR